MCRVGVGAYRARLTTSSRPGREPRAMGVRIELAGDSDDELHEALNRIGRVLDVTLTATDEATTAGYYGWSAHYTINAAAELPRPVRS